MNRAAFITPNRLDNKYNGGSIASIVLLQQLQDALGSDWILTPICVTAPNAPPLISLLSKILRVLQFRIPSYNSLPNSVLASYDLLIVDTVLPITCLSGCAEILPVVFIWHNIESEYLKVRSLGILSKLYLSFVVRRAERKALASRSHHLFLSSDDRTSILSNNVTIASNSSVLQLDLSLLQRESGVDPRVLHNPSGSDLSRAFAGLDASPCGFFLGSPNNANLSSIFHLAATYRWNEWTHGPIILVGAAWKRSKIARRRTDLFFIIDHIDNPSCFLAFDIPLVIPKVHSCGIKIKVLLFLSLGVPIVSVPDAFSGLSEYINQNCAIIKDSSQLDRALADKSLQLTCLVNHDNNLLCTYGTSRGDLRRVLTRLCSPVIT
jgi:hypothetical protein